MAKTKVIMNILIIRDKAKPEEVKEMLTALESYIKLAVDIKRSIVSGGGILHADCEAVLLEDGSEQNDIWGADWLPETKEVRFESLINIKPRQRNRSMVIQNSEICTKVADIVKKKFIR